MFDKLEDLLIRFEEILNMLNDPSVMADQQRFQKLLKEQGSLQPLVDTYKEYKNCRQTIDDSLAMLEEESDEEMREMLKEELSQARKRIEELERELKILLLPKDPNDDKNVIVEIRAGAGGDEAALFAAEIYRMYVHYAESQRWKVETMDVEEIGIGGMKYVSFMITGREPIPDSNTSPASTAYSGCRRLSRADGSIRPRLPWRSCRRRKRWMSWSI